MEILVENIKCGGCAGTITKKLNAKFNIDSTEVHIDQGMISLDIEDNKRHEVVAVLLDLGYPEINSVQGFVSVKAKAKSFVSCAIGKIDK